MLAPVRVQRFDADAIAPEPWLRRLHDDALEVLVIRGWYAPEVVQQVTRTLTERHDHHPLWQHRDHPDPKRPQTRVLGQPTSPSDVHRNGPERASYFADARRFRELLSELFHDAPFEARLAALLARLAPGVPVDVADDGHGAPYGVATIRCMPRGFGLPPHCENDYMHIPIYDGLRERVQLPKVLSYFMPLAMPEAGGELVVHARRWLGPSGAGDLRTFMAEPHEVIALDPGDLVLFPSGRIFHSVLAARGDQPRWTIGGFGAYTSDDTRFLYWA